MGLGTWERGDGSKGKPMKVPIWNVSEMGAGNVMLGGPQFWGLISLHRFLLLYPCTRILRQGIHKRLIHLLFCSCIFSSENEKRKEW